MIRFACALPVALLAAVSPAQSASEWRRSQMSAAALGKRVDAALGNLKNAYGETSLIVQTPSGNGNARSVIKIADRSKYLIEYVWFDRGRPFTSGIRGNGGKVSVLSQEGWEAAKPASGLTPPPTGLSLVQGFNSIMPRLVWTPITNAKPIFEPLASGYARGIGGYQARVEEKVSHVGGKRIVNYRILATRHAAGAKTYGPSSIEIRVDGQYWLPVTIRIDNKDTKGRPHFMQWQSFWRFGQKFDPKEFVLN
ncbi:MAG TPA: hypothetical protein VM328_08835 [Fimbriimonadaceae bacterium]|nr:hypothetical protein [Fimbriimonadaceae bacterium]